MSAPNPPSPVIATTRALKRKDLSSTDAADINDLDHALKRIKTVIPHVPYILSTPSMVPYRYHSQQEANAWMLGRLWRVDEEHLQYRTYLYREPCQDCMELQAGEDEEVEPGLPRSVRTENGAPAKKKISLSAFKTKQINGLSVLGKEGTVRLAKARSPLENGAKEERESDSVRKREHSRLPVQSPTQQPNSRKGDKSNEDRRSDPPPRPPSASQNSDSDSRPVDKSHPSNSTPHGLPPLLSPVHNPPTNPYGLPDILSPTLPSNIQVELERLEKQRQRAESNASKSSSTDDKPLMQISKAAAQKVAETAKSEARSTAAAVNGKSPVHDAHERSSKNGPTLVVVLKFSRAKIPTVRQILRLPPKRPNGEKKERHDIPKESTQIFEPKSDNITIKKKQVAKIAVKRPERTGTKEHLTAKSTTATSTAASKLPEKRHRPADDDTSSAVPTKKPKSQSAQDRPITPVQQSASPSLSNRSSAQKPPVGTYTTPKNNHRAVSMLRTTSTESNSNDATPGRPAAATPASIKQEGRVAAAPTSNPTSSSTTVSSKKQAEIAAMAHTSMKLNQMGRALKHEATKILSARNLNKQEEKRAAVMNLECILSYMTAYHTQDLSLCLRSRPSDVESTWKTLLPLCASYARCTRDFPHLDGLRAYLSAIVASTIVAHVAARSTGQKSHDSPHDAPTPAAPGGAEREKGASATDNFALLADHSIKMTRLFLDARTLLPLDTISHTYPKTYGARETNATRAKEVEKLSARRLSGAFFLPLGVETSPIQAVRFGLRFLEEYCRREEVGWRARVELDRGD